MNTTLARWLASILLVSLICLAIVGAMRVEVSANNRDLFDSGQWYYANLLDLESLFGTSSEIVFVLRCKGYECSEDRLREASKHIRNSLLDIPEVSSFQDPYSLTVTYLDGEILRVSPVYGDECLSYPSCSSASKAVIEKFDRRVSLRQGAYVVQRASVDLGVRKSELVLGLEAALTEISTRFRSRFDEFELEWTGAVPMMGAFYSASQSDFSVLGPVTLAVMLVALAFSFSSLSASLVLLLHATLSTCIAIGVLGVLGQSLNAATSTVPLIVITLVVASNMHVYIDYALSADEFGNSRSPDFAIWRNASALTVAMLTTIVGLLSLLFVSSPALKALGVSASAGVVAGYLITFALLPEVFRRRLIRAQPHRLAVIRRFTNRLAKSAERSKGGWIGIALLSVLSLSSFFIFSFDEDFVSYFPESNQFRANTTRVAEIAHSPYSVDIVVEDVGGEGLFRQELMRQVRDFSLQARNGASIANVYSISDVLDTAEAAFPEAGSSDGGLEQLLLAAELGLDGDESLGALVTPDRKAIRISILFHSVDMVTLRSEANALLSEVKERLASVCSNCRIYSASEGLASSYLSIDGVRQITVGIAVSWMFSFVLLLLITRSKKIAASIVLCSLLPVLFGVASLAFATGTFGLATILVIGVTIGVVIDDAIHFGLRASYAVKELKLSVPEAAGYAVHRVGPAIFTSSFVLVCGFSCLLMSSYQLNWAFGLGVCTVVGFAGWVCLFALPKLLASGVFGRGSLDVKASTESVGQGW